MDSQVGATACRFKKRVGGRRTPTVPDRILPLAETDRLRAVIVIGDRQALGMCRLDPCLENGVDGLGMLRTDRAVATAPGTGAFFPGLAAFEIRKNLGMGPAGGAIARPPVVVARMASGIGHDVHRGRSAQNLAALDMQAAAVHRFVRLAHIAPVVELVLMDLADADRDVD